MNRGLVFLCVCLAVTTLGAGRAAAIRCLVGPIELTTSPMDAIFVGAITRVERMQLAGPPKICSRWPKSPQCRAAIATVTVGKTWKGQPGESTTVYSHDEGRMDYGDIFKAGEKMLFMLVRNTGGTGAEYLPYFCGQTISEEEAREAGLLDELDKLLVFPDPAK